MLTISEIAERIAALDGREVEGVRNQLKNPNLRAFMRAAPRTGGKTTADRFAHIEAMRARVLLAAIDVGLDARELAPINEALNGHFLGVVPKALTSEDGTNPSTVLGLAAASASAQVPMYLQVRFLRRQHAQREIRVSAQFHPIGDPKAAEVLKLREDLDGYTQLGVLLLPVSDLLRPLAEG